MKDYKLCSDLSFVVRDFLSYQYEHFPKVRGFVGFKSGSLCIAPALYYPVLYEQHEEFKCERDQSGYYNPICREWFIQQAENVDSAILTDLYRDAS